MFVPQIPLSSENMELFVDLPKIMFTKFPPRVPHYTNMKLQLLIGVPGEVELNITAEPRV